MTKHTSDLNALIEEARKRFVFPGVALWTSETGLSRRELRRLERLGYLTSATSRGTFPVRRVWRSEGKLFNEREV